LILPALLPLGRAGFFESHDGQFHVYRLAALDHAVRAGVLYPRWFPGFAFGYGQPVLNFYGPLSYYLGLPFTLLGADPALAMKLVLTGGLVTSALGMYLFCRRYLDRGPALVAAVVYGYIPYHLADLYTRGAVAEFLAFAWFPLVLWGFQRLIEEGERRVSTAAMAALLLAALLLTHSLSVVVFAPLLGAYVGFLLLKRRETRPVGRVALVLILSVALSAFYWLPVLTEAQHVGLGHGTSQGYKDHLLPLAGLVSTSPTYAYQSEPGVPITFSLGLVQVLILVAAFFLPFSAPRLRGPALLFLAVALASAFMLTTISLPVWRAFEGGLAFLQYPWRFEALTALSTAFLAGGLVQWLTGVASTARIAVGVFLLLATGAWALWRLPVSQIMPDFSIEGMWRLDRQLGQVGATWTGEYLPIWVEEQRWALSLSPQEPVSYGEPVPPGQVRLNGVGYTRLDLAADVPQETALVLHQFHYPGWQARWQGKVIPSYPQSSLGLAAFDLPNGKGNLVVRLGFTPGQLWGTLISLSVLVALGVVLLVQSRAGGPSSLVQTGLIAAGHLLPAAVLLGSLILPNGYLRAVEPVQANLEDSVELLAFDADGTAYHPGDTIQITLYWRSLRGLDQDLKTSVQLAGMDVSDPLARHDGDPGGGYTPATRWLPGELVPDRHDLNLPADLAPGRYRLWAAIYDFSTVRNLKVVSAEAPTDGNRVLLGEVEVVSP
jgi:hypothetical protein